MKTCPACGASYGNETGFCPRDGSALRSGGGFEPGEIIRRKYEILGEIGRGGMGVVYRARHLMWNEEKALKVLSASASAVPQGIKGLLAEALVMRQLQHPHIVRVEDADYTEDDQPFVVMEYVHGESLRQRLDRGGPLAPELALQIAAQACSALAAAHQKGIIHRDMKPQNLLLAKAADGSEWVKVIDFGIAKVREEAGLGITGMITSATGMFMGTPGYASPEQAQGMRGADLDGRTDLYSLGLVLYEMLTGRLPFAADTPVGVLLQRLQVPPLPLDRARPGRTFPPDVAGIVMKALERERENRYRSAEEMERAIAAVLDAQRAKREQQERETVALPVGQASRPVSPEPKKKPSATTVPSKRAAVPTNRLKWIAAAFLALLGIGLAIWLSRAPGTNPAPATPAASTKPAAPQERVRTNPKDGLLYVPISPGKFMMGCSSGDSECFDGEKPAHEVEITRGFWLAQTPITVGAWRRYRTAAGKPALPTGDSLGRKLNEASVDDNLPVVAVTWEEARAFCEWSGGRLPTEAEWEYAERAGSTGARHGSLDEIAWYADNSGKQRVDSAEIWRTDQLNYAKRLLANGNRPHPVGQKKPNAWYLYDMLGNVWQWTADWYGKYQAGAQSDPSGPPGGRYRVLRGGSWSTDPPYARASYRCRNLPEVRGSHFGARCVGN